MTAKRSTWPAIGVLVAVLSFAWNVLQSRTETPQPEVPVFFLGPLGVPQTDLEIVYPDGQRVAPDLDGLVKVPHNRGGQQASVRRRDNRQELCSFTVPASSPRPIRIDSTQQGGQQCLLK